jgi:hypothetical protein
MKVKELIQKLELCDPELDVYLSYDYGDRCGSIVTEPISEAYKETMIWSEYHRRYSLSKDDEEPDWEDINNVIHPPKEAVVIG